MKTEKTQQALDKLCEMIKTEKRVKFMIVNNPMVMGKRLGQYNRVTKQIKVRNIEDEDEFLSIVAHEFAHFVDYEVNGKKTSEHTISFFQQSVYFKDLLKLYMK